MVSVLLPVLNVIKEILLAHTGKLGARLLLIPFPPGSVQELKQADCLQYDCDSDESCVPLSPSPAAAVVDVVAAAAVVDGGGAAA